MPGVIRLDGSQLSFRDAADSLVFERHWSQLKVVHVARDHAFGQGVVLRAADGESHQIALMNPELSRTVKGTKGWAIGASVFVGFAMVARDPFVSVLFWLAGALAVRAVVRRARVLVADRTEFWRASRAVRTWKAALNAWP